MEYLVNQTRIKFIRGDITAQDTEAIVNAANSSLLGGGGVDGAIHRAGGPQILAACKKIRATKGLCHPGEAVITTGGNLPADHVIHTVGPIWRGGNHGEPDLLRSAYRNSLALARENGLRSISFPSISTGAYRYPKEKAALIAVGVISAFAAANGKPEEIRMVLFSDQDLQVYIAAWKKIAL
ncbi:MAG TPA: O-acetyl-ADP-ribose deacetylase [Desulfotomaculum sp.]|nr:MAG: hypothetical protein JL56_16785 [Desulfotomaculum sp. BICA1-6]HBX23586.1 O-acetyl-ADP-ribose deacetylase [Desulfotomaculum sp.]